MFKPVFVANKPWWVPENNSQTLAVQISNPEEYRQAVILKMEELADQAGLEEASHLAVQILTDEGALKPWGPATSTEELVAWVLENSVRVACMIREGGPDMAEPASAEDAKEAVEMQAELDWGEFLTSGSIQVGQQGDGGNAGGAGLREISDVELDEIFDDLDCQTAMRGGGKPERVIPPDLADIPGLTDLIAQLGVALGIDPAPAASGEAPAPKKGKAKD